MRYQTARSRSLGEFIKQLLQDKDLTQRKFAKQANLTTDYVSRLVNGKITEPRQEQYRRILQGLGITEQEFQQLFDQFKDKGSGYTPDSPANNLPSSSTNNPSAANSRHIYQNLPAPTYTEFIGREAEMSRLLELLSSNHPAHIITVSGIGGVGKTSLVVEAASKCLKASCDNLPDAPTFDAIIFTSAKQQYLTSSRFLGRPQVQRNLRDIFREIAVTLNEPTITQSTPEEQSARVSQILSRQRTLLIVDNMETMQDDQEVIGFLYDLPADVKIVITIRKRMGFVPIVLPSLLEAEGLELIKQQAQEKGITLSDSESRQLYEQTGGVPIAIVYAIGQIYQGYSLKLVLMWLASNTGDVAQFCFEQSVQGIRTQPPHQLLMSLAIFPKSPIRDAVAEVAGLTTNPTAVDDGLGLLQKLSLISRKDEYYGMLSLTREYALAELAAYPDFEQEARERWVKWYLDFAQKYGGLDREEWHIQYDYLDNELENFIAVFDWCKAKQRYENIRDLFSCLYYYLYLYGYWDEGLRWVEWLIQESERRGDWAVAVNAMYLKGWVMLLMKKLNQAEELLLSRAWELREHASLLDRVALATYMPALFIRQGNYQEAHHWIDRNKELMNHPELQDRVRIRFQTFTLYSLAEIAYLKKDYEQAKLLFQKVIEDANKIRWQRYINYAHNWLADIAIVQNNLEEAEKLLNTGLPVAERNKDKWRTTCYQSSFARLEKARRNSEKARKWANKALDGFTRLGMKQDAEQMQALLNELI